MAAPQFTTMRFKSGYLGVLLVTLCLFGSALLCIIANVEKENVITTKYDYVTDVTGLFDFSDAPQYTEYNPNANYIGYTNSVSTLASPSGISFVSSNSVNNYAVMVAPGTTVSGPSGTVNNSTSLPQATFDSSPVIALNASDPAVFNSTAVGARLYNFKVATVYDWVNSIWPNISTYQEITINLTLPTGAPIKNAIFCYYPYVAPGTGELTLTVVGGRSNVVNSLTINPSDYTVTFNGTLANSSPYSNTLSMYESWICYGIATQRENYFTYDGGQIGAGESLYNVAMDLTYTSTVTNGAEYQYMIPSGGVTLAANGSSYYSTIWANGETNGKVTIVFDGGLNTAAAPGANLLNVTYGGVTYGISLTKSDAWQLIVTNGTDTESLNAGAYRQVALTIDIVNGVVQLRPVSFTNFVDFTIIDTVLAESSLIAAGEGIEQITFNPVTGVAPLRWSIGSTTVLMDTFGAVMVDPSIEVNEYWPNMALYRLWFQSFALYGDSVTINGRTFNVTDESIVISNDSVFNVVGNYAYINGGAYPVTDGNVTIGNVVYSVTDNYITISNTYAVNDGRIEINGVTYLVINGSVMVDGVAYPVINNAVTVRSIYPVLNGVVVVDDVAYTVTDRTVLFNGVRYNIVNDRVTIPGFIDKTYKFDNFYISYAADNHVYLTFVENDDTVDLGEKVSDTISFDGIWYFSAGLYEGTETTEERYNWAVGWNGSPDMFILISLGLLAAGVVVVRKTRGLTMGILDWMAVIIAVVALAGFLGGF